MNIMNVTKALANKVVELEKKNLTSVLNEADETEKFQILKSYWKDMYGKEFDDMVFLTDIFDDDDKVQFERLCTMNEKYHKNLDVNPYDTWFYLDDNGTPHTCNDENLYHKFYNVSKLADCILSDTDKIEKKKMPKIHHWWKQFRKAKKLQDKL